jgi:hypothetical protein
MRCTLHIDSLAPCGWRRNNVSLATLSSARLAHLTAFAADTDKSGALVVLVRATDGVRKLTLIVQPSEVKAFNERYQAVLRNNTPALKNKRAAKTDSAAAAVAAATAAAAATSSSAKKKRKDPPTPAATAVAAPAPAPAPAPAVATVSSKKKRASERSSWAVQFAVCGNARKSLGSLSLSGMFGFAVS